MTQAARVCSQTTELLSASAELIEQARATRSASRRLQRDAATLRFVHRRLVREGPWRAVAMPATRRSPIQPSPWSRLPWECLADEQLAGVLEPLETPSGALAV